MSADVALRRAAAVEEKPNPRAEPGVVFQHVQLRVKDRRIDWAVYRDRRGQRVPRFLTATAYETALTRRLALAGVFRAEPLSASSFNGWRNGLGKHSDHVDTLPSGLIAVTTIDSSASLSPVREETLTLREADFHPVARSVTFRGEEVVEIAELEYKLFDWSQARREWFDDTEEPIRLPAMTRRLASRVPDLTIEQLELAELQARLVLSRQDADVNEQLVLDREPAEVVVRGLVSTPERKQQLQSALSLVPHVTVAILTPDEQSAADSALPGPRQSSIQLLETVSRPSPLLLYWKSLHRNPDGFTNASSQILNAGLRIRQQSHAMRELAHGYSTPLDVQQQEAYNALWRDHEEKLLAALADQARILKTLAPEAPAAAISTSAHQFTVIAQTADALDRAAASLLELSRELTTGEDSKQREAPAILADLADRSSRMNALLNQRDSDNNSELAPANLP